MTRGGDLRARRRAPASRRRAPARSCPTTARRPDAELALEARRGRRRPRADERARSVAHQAGPSPSRRPPSQIRRLSYPDLPQVIAIERRVFPTPWSLAMFVLELSKQTGHLPGGACAERAARRLPDLLALRHRLARDEHRRRPRPPAPGPRLGAARRAVRARRRRPRRASRSRCAAPTRVAIHLYEREGFRAAGMRRRYYQDNGEDALVMWRTPATLAGLARRRAQPRPPYERSSRWRRAATTPARRSSTRDGQDRSRT